MIQIRMVEIFLPLIIANFTLITEKEYIPLI
jgi:hypothetical protein